MLPRIILNDEQTARVCMLGKDAEEPQLVLEFWVSSAYLRSTLQKLLFPMEGIVEINVIVMNAQDGEMNSKVCMCCALLSSIPKCCRGSSSLFLIAGKPGCAASAASGALQQHATCGAGQAGGRVHQLTGDAGAAPDQGEVALVATGRLLPRSPCYGGCCPQE